MVAQIEEFKAGNIAGFDGRAGRNSAEIGGRDDIIETFYWRLDEGSKPQELQVRPYAIKQNDLATLDRKVAEANAIEERINILIGKRPQFEEEVFLESLDRSVNDTEESPAAKKLRLIDERIAELERNPTPTELVAELFFRRVIVSWPFTVNGELVPLTVEGIAAQDPIFLRILRQDLQDFFFSEKRLKSRTP